jgi:hypothetical protein
MTGALSVHPTQDKTEAACDGENALKTVNTVSEGKETITRSEETSPYSKYVRAASPHDECLISQKLISQGSGPVVDNILPCISHDKTGKNHKELAKPKKKAPACPSMCIEEPGPVSSRPDLKAEPYLFRTPPKYWELGGVSPGIKRYWQHDWPSGLPVIPRDRFSGLIFDDRTQIDTVIFHAKCPDGLLACYAAYLKLGKRARYWGITHADTDIPDVIVGDLRGRERNMRF